MVCNYLFLIEFLERTSLDPVMHSFQRIAYDYKQSICKLEDKVDGTY